MEASEYGLAPASVQAPSRRGRHRVRQAARIAQGGGTVKACSERFIVKILDVVYEHGQFTAFAWATGASAKVLYLGLTISDCEPK